MNKIYTIAFIAVCLIALTCVGTLFSIKVREALFIIFPFSIGSFFLGFCSKRKLTTLSSVSASYLTVGMFFPRYITGAWAQKAEISLFVVVYAFLLAFFVSLVVVFSGRLLRKYFRKEA
jgi:hypothetical protein